MWQLLRGTTEIIVQDGFLYVPLLFDPDIAAAVAAGGGEGRAAVCSCEATDLNAGPATPLLQRQGHYFIQSLSLAALVDHYDAVFPEEYERARKACLGEILSRLATCRPLLDSTLQAILFEVFPYFLRTRIGKKRPQGRNVEAVLAALAASLPTPVRADSLLRALAEQVATLQGVVQWLAARQAAVAALPPPPAGGPALQQWLHQALQARIIARELARRQEELAALQSWQHLPERQLAVLLILAARGAAEVDGIGFCRDAKRSGAYWVYKRSGPFVLQDYYGRPYLFPDCRVAVSTAGPFQPVVLDTYKHPLLRRLAPRQPICLTDYQPPQEFSAPAVIRALQEGLNALYYGYNSRKRNGYNSLDGLGQHHSVVDFADWRLPKNDPRLLSGELEVKNR